jgi:hypothetical protein
MAFLTLFSAIDHRTWKTELPVRSVVLKPCAGRLVVGWVTTSESLLLIVLHFLLLLQQSPLAGIPQRLSSPQPSYLRVTVTWRLLWLPIPDVAGRTFQSSLKKTPYLWRRHGQGRLGVMDSASGLISRADRESVQVGQSKSEEQLWVWYKL